MLDFGWALVQNLTTSFIENRSLNGLPSMVQQTMCIILKRKMTSRNPSVELFPARNKQRKKCRLCINDLHGTGYKSIKKTVQSIQRNAKSVLNVYAPFISCRFVSIDRVKIQLAFYLSHRKLIYLLSILHLPIVILISEDFTNICKYNFVIDKTMYKTNKHLVL